MKISDFHSMSIRARTALNRAGIETVEEAKTWTDEALLLLDGFGQGSLDRLRAWQAADDTQNRGAQGLDDGLERLRNQLGEEILLRFVEKQGYGGSSADLAHRAKQIAAAFYPEVAA